MIIFLEYTVVKFLKQPLVKLLLIPTLMTLFLRTCFAASTPLRWSVAEAEETAALDAAVSLLKSEIDEEPCCRSLEADEVRCTTCEVEVDSEAAAA